MSDDRLPAIKEAIFEASGPAPPNLTWLVQEVDRLREENQQLYAALSYILVVERWVSTGTINSHAQLRPISRERCDKLFDLLAACRPLGGQE